MTIGASSARRPARVRTLYARVLGRQVPWPTGRVRDGSTLLVCGGVGVDPGCADAAWQSFEMWNCRWRQPSSDARAGRCADHERVQLRRRVAGDVDGPGGAAEELLRQGPGILGSNLPRLCSCLDPIVASRGQATPVVRHEQEDASGPRTACGLGSVGRRTRCGPQPSSCCGRAC